MLCRVIFALDAFVGYAGVEVTDNGIQSHGHTFAPSVLYRARKAAFNASIMGLSLSLVVLTCVTVRVRARVRVRVRVWMSVSVYASQA